jgi:hypothetical protein
MLTAEDVAIWHRVARWASSRHGMETVWNWAHLGDRCDAELMSFAQRHRWQRWARLTSQVTPILDEWCFTRGGKLGWYS